MRVVVLVPYRPDGGRRDELWRFVRGWLYAKHPDWPVVVGVSPDGPFNRGAAINDAARKAGDWDVAVVHDADNIADPETVRQAARQAHATGRCFFPFQTYLYLDRFSSDRLMSDGNWFVSPQLDDWSVTRSHCSGVQAISRVAYQRVGGFVEMQGWGHEDVVMAHLLNTFADGFGYLPGSAYHLHHDRGTEPRQGACEVANRQIRADIMALSVVPARLRRYLQDGGHPIPDRQIP